MSTATGLHTGRAIYTGLTAAGTNQATALQLAGRGDSLQEITTVSSSTGVMLPPTILPMRIEIANQGSNTLSIYPQIGGSIDNGTANAAVTLAAGKSSTFEASSLTNWYTVASTAGSGSGTVTSVTFTGDGTVLSSTPSSAVTTSGTVAATLATQAKNVALAGPATGLNAAPTFRALVAADLPTTALEIDQCQSVITSDNDGATITFNLATSNWHTVTIVGNRTLALSNPVTGQQFTLVLVQDGTGSRTVTWFSTIKWAGGTAPTLTTTAGKADIFTFKCYGSGTYYGMVAGQNF
jgi:hypothetical protein